MLNSSDKLIPITEGTDEAMDATAQSIVGFHHHLRHAVQTEFARAINSDASIVIVTRGKRFDQDKLDPKGRKHFVIDVAHLYDPARDPAMASHVGWVPGISRSLIKLSGFVKALKSIKDAVDACDSPRGILVEVRCKSGRHRSVCAGFCSYHQMLRYGHSALLLHYQSPEWAGMKCGATCSACRDHDKCLQEIGSILPQGQSIAQTHGVQSIAQTPSIERSKSRRRSRSTRRSRSPLRRRPRNFPPPPRRRRRSSRSESFSRKRDISSPVRTAVRNSWPPVKAPPVRPPPRAESPRDTSSPVRTDVRNTWPPVKAPPVRPPPRAESPRTGANTSSSSNVPLLSPPLHRHQRGQTSHRVELEALLRDDLAQGAPFHATTARPDLLNKETLEAAISLCSREGPRTKKIWITDPLLHQRDGVRMFCLLRGRANMLYTPTSCKSWKRTTWMRTPPDNWRLLEDRASAAKDPPCSHGSLDLVTFLQPP